MTEENKKIMKPIAIYSRVSTSNQKKEGTIETQILAMREFAEKNSYLIVKEYVDNGWSGDILARPDLDRMRNDASKKIWNTVLIYDPDRLARRRTYQEIVIEELQNLGIEVLYVTVPPPKNDEDVFMYKMRAVFSEYERMKITERFRMGKIRKANEGHILASVAPYGFNFVPQKGKKGDSFFQHGFYEINEIETQNVRNMFKWVADGMTLRGLVKKLQELNVPPRKSKRGVWSTSTLSRLLRNRTYIGEASYCRTCAIVPKNPLKIGGYKKIKKTSRRIRPENERIKITIPQIQIIDKELFERVQWQLKTNFELAKRNKKNQYLLSQMIWCVCGCRRTGEGPMQGKNLYYRCTNRVKSFPLPSTCGEKGINAKIADSLIWQEVVRIMGSPELIKKHIKKWLNERQDKINGLEINVEAVKKEIAKLKEQDDRFAKAYAAGLFSIEKLKEYISPAREKISMLENQIARAKAGESQRKEYNLPKPDEIEIFAQEAVTALQNLNFEAKQAIVRSIVNKAVGTQRELKVYGYIPINYVELFTIHRNCRFAECGEVHAV